MGDIEQQDSMLCSRTFKRKACNDRDPLLTPLKERKRLRSPLRGLRLSPIRQPVGDENCPWTSLEHLKPTLHNKGQLKLAVYANYGLLTVHVMQARHLSSKLKETCDSFVKLSLVPDENRRTRCRTENVHDTNHPLYDEKFSFELLDEDMNKRLLVSIWHRDNQKKKSEFLGCMSFGIQHIMTQKRTINGWYYLLTEEVGRRKHLQVASKRTQLTEISHKNISKVNRDILWMEPHTMVIKRCLTGYGFSLTGSSPVRVCRVDPDSPADQAGVLRDDCIVRVNGVNVSRSTAESIAKIVRQSGKQLVLEIQRPKNTDLCESLETKPLSSTMKCRSPGSYCSYSDGELTESESGRTPFGFCATLPRKRVTFKDNIC